jgi:hypothetical protein
MPRSAISKCVSHLEHSLGVRLLNCGSLSDRRFQIQLVLSDEQMGPVQSEIPCGFRVTREVRRNGFLTCA